MDQVEELGTQSPNSKIYNPENSNQLAEYACGHLVELPKPHPKLIFKHKNPQKL